MPYLSAAEPIIQLVNTYTCITVVTDYVSQVLSSNDEDTLVSLHTRWQLASLGWVVGDWGEKLLVSQSTFFHECGGTAWRGCGGDIMCRGTAWRGCRGDIMCRGTAWRGCGEIL